jgi:hypothetical protein
VSGINVAYDAIFSGAALGGREDDRAAFAFAFDAFWQALHGATDLAFRRPAEQEVKAAACSPVDARLRDRVIGLKGSPCCDAVVGVWRGGIDIDREHASSPAHGHSDQRVRVLPEVATHHHRIGCRAVHSMRVERLLLPDRAYGEHWDVGLRESQRSVERRSSARGGGDRLSPKGEVGSDREYRARVPVGLGGFAR